MVYELNALRDFDFNMLHDPEFNEASVREEIIAPILKALQYSSGGNRIVRDKHIKNPFLYAAGKKIEAIIPDYVIEINGKPSLIIEAKSPSINIKDEKWISQAYVYAVHREVQAQYFALCNGWEFSLYKVRDCVKVLSFDVQKLDEYWDLLCSFLLPENLYQIGAPDIKPDYGIHLKSLGLHSCFIYLYGIYVHSFDRINPDLFSITINMVFDGVEYCASFDFDLKTLLFGLETKLPKEAIWMASCYEVDHNPLRIELGEDAFEVNMKVQVSKEIEKNKDEVYIPIVVKEFF